MYPVNALRNRALLMAQTEARLALDHDPFMTMRCCSPSCSLSRGASLNAVWHIVLRWARKELVS